MNEKALLVRREKGTDRDGDLLELVIWEIRGGAEVVRVKYRLAFVPIGNRRPAVLYDNHHPKGHHRHLGDFEESYQFNDVETLMADFQADVNRWKEQRALK